MIIVTYRKTFFAITAAITLVALAAIFIFGLKLGTDFTGGTLIEARYEGNRPTVEALTQSLEGIGLHGSSVREAQNNQFIIRAPNLSNEQREKMQSALSIGDSKATIESLTEVGPTIGNELRTKAGTSLGFVLLAILLFIAFAFRKVSKPISSWVYGLIALVTLMHDVIVPLGFFAVLGHYFGAQVDTLFVTAILTILGYSVHDTIVVFDRTRENLHINHETGKKEDFAVTAGRSLNQAFVRSVNTSVTVLISLGVLFFIGPVSTQDFALTLIVGIVAGTYSSIALATPLLVSVAKWQEKRI